jgi:hypothetical protein
MMNKLTDIDTNIGTVLKQMRTPVDTLVDAVDAVTSMADKLTQLTDQVNRVADHLFSPPPPPAAAAAPASPQQPMLPSDDDAKREYWTTSAGHRYGAFKAEGSSAWSLHRVLPLVAGEALHFHDGDSAPSRFLLVSPPPLLSRDPPPSLSPPTLCPPSCSQDNPNVLDDIIFIPSTSSILAKKLHAIGAIWDLCQSGTLVGTSFGHFYKVR